jgi:hypothetical protein
MIRFAHQPHSLIVLLSYGLMTRLSDYPTIRLVATSSEGGF